MEFSTTARILMCPPDYFGIEYEINPWMNMQQGTNPQPVRRQWQRLYQTLCDLGAAIDLLEPIPGLPDLVFTANAGLVFHDMFLPARFRFGVRQGESPHFEKWARDCGFTLVPLPESMNFEGAGTPSSAAIRCSPVIAFAVTSEAISGSESGWACRRCHWNLWTRGFITWTLASVRSLPVWRSITLAPSTSTAVRS